MSGDEIEASGMVFRWTNILIGIQSSLIVLPINIIIVTLFRKAAPLQKGKIKNSENIINEEDNRMELDEVGNDRKASIKQNTNNNKDNNSQLAVHGYSAKSELLENMAYSYGVHQNQHKNKGTILSGISTPIVESMYETAPNSILDVTDNTSNYKDAFQSMTHMSALPSYKDFVKSPLSDNDVCLEFFHLSKYNFCCCGGMGTTQSIHKNMKIFFRSFSFA